MVGALKTKRISRGVDSAGFLDFLSRKITRGFSPLMDPTQWSFDYDYFDEKGVALQ